MSDDTTAEEKAAQRQLDDAVNTFMASVGWNEGVMTSWVLVGHHASFDGDGEPLSSYPMVYMGGTQPDHVAEGLLRRGLKILNDGMVMRGDED